MGINNVVYANIPKILNKMNTKLSKYIKLYLIVTRHDLVNYSF